MSETLYVRFYPRLEGLPDQEPFYWTLEQWSPCWSLCFEKAGE